MSSDSVTQAGNGPGRGPGPGRRRRAGESRALPGHCSHSSSSSTEFDLEALTASGLSQAAGLSQPAACHKQLACESESDSDSAGGSGPSPPSARASQSAIMICASGHGSRFSHRESVTVTCSTGTHAAMIQWQQSVTDSASESLRLS